MTKMRFLLGCILVLPIYLLVGLPIGTAQVSADDMMVIHDFDVREHMLKNGKLAIVALDTAGIPQERVDGSYQFVVNGFQQSIRFNEGIGVAAQPIESSTFVFVKHKNHTGSVGKLFYVSKKENDLKIYPVNWYYLILIPLVILIIAYLFKRLLILALIVLAGWFIFNYNKGLDFGNLLDTIVHGIRGIGGG